MSVETKTGSTNLQTPAEARLVKAAILEGVAAACERAYAGTLRALVLTGSLARNEATFVASEGGWNSSGDAEFFLVFDERSALPSVQEVKELSAQISAALRERKIHCEVGLDAVHPRYFSSLRPHIFAYELRTCGRVIRGDDKILSLIPDFPAAAIPLEDAWRLLANRMIELLEVLPAPRAARAPVTQKVLYRTAKLYLDMATSLLVFVGHYEPTYGGRLERLRSMASQLPQQEGLPFPLEEFARRVELCTRFKIEGVAGGWLAVKDEGEAARFCKEALNYARRLWRWELARLTHQEGETSDRELLRAWMRLQPLAARLRGWLFVLRACGWLKSWPEWPRWLRLARQASPRYWVYAVASELLFAMDGSSRPASDDPARRNAWQEIRLQLPVLFEQNTAQVGWQGVVADVARNYHQFLEKTRA